jgi:lipopolysaccharide assembly outer membrane protein LptD (OstA)
MKEWLFAFLSMGFVLITGGAWAQTAGDWQVETTGPKGDIEFSNGIARATGGVLIKYRAGRSDAAELTSEEAILTQATGEVTAVGNVILRRDGLTWRAERIDYNFKTKRVKSTQFRSGNSQIYFSGEQIDGNTTAGFYTARNVKFTTDDIDKPDFYIKAKKVHIVPGEKIEFHGASLYAGELPIAYMPYYERSLKRHPWNVHLEPGFRSNWGPYLLSALRWPGSKQFGGEMNFDYRADRGFALGPDLKWDLDNWGSGDLESYLAFDENPMNDSDGNPLDRERQRLAFDHKAEWENLSFLSVFSYESDEYVRRDFFESDYRENAQPQTFLELNQNWADYNLSLLAQPRINDHYGTLERLPDLKLTGLRQRIKDTPFYYDQETSIAYLRRKYANDTNPWFSGMRTDSLQQFYLPQTYFGWLQFTPRIGGRWTHYGETDGTGPNSNDQHRLLINTGAELSAKASRFYPDASSKLLELDGLRHIAKPSLNYVFVPRPNKKPFEIPNYEYELASSSLLPIMYPDYNSIDQIDGQNALRIGLRNRLQTRRNGHVEDFVDWNTYTDWRLNPLEDQHDFADIFSDLYVRPRSWIVFGSRLRLDIDDDVWRVMNNSITFEPKTRWSTRLGHFYYLEPGKTSKADRSSVAYTSFAYRFNEDWSFGMSHYYDAKRNRLSDQVYTLYRDFRSWTGYLDLRLIDNEGPSREGNDFQISINFSLKGNPQTPGRH